VFQRSNTVMSTPAQEMVREMERIARMNPTQARWLEEDYARDAQYGLDHSDREDESYGEESEGETSDQQGE